jgi:thiamine biosynthesis lipoprotein
VNLTAIDRLKAYSLQNFQFLNLVSNWRLLKFIKVFMPDNLTIDIGTSGISSVRFSAMASPCEILVCSEESDLLLELGEIAQKEALRIEAKFSRYRPDSVLSRLNASDGKTIAVDPETALLLDFAKQCYELSGGMFDVTSGILRCAWTFDGSDRLPSPNAVNALLPYVGFEKLHWASPNLTMPPGMEIDFGGIGKEYAVDSVLQKLNRHIDLPKLVNFGGDLCANRAPIDQDWQVGIERPDAENNAALVLELTHGALATSGDTRRFLMKDGQRYSHILNPFTGWPVPGAPQSVTVAAATCMEAGMLATFSLLQGENARNFLRDQKAMFWCLD